MMLLLMLAAAAMPSDFAPKPGDRVDASPFGLDSKWESCLVVRADPRNGGYLVRCEGRGTDFFVGQKWVRPPRLLVPQPASPQAAPPLPMAPAKASPKSLAPSATVARDFALKPGKYQCYYLAGTSLNYSFVDVVITGASSYKDRTGAAGLFSRSGNNITFNSGPLAKHRAEVKAGRLVLFAPGATFGMSCTP